MDFLSGLASLAGNALGGIANHFINPSPPKPAPVKTPAPQPANVNPVVKVGNAIRGGINFANKNFVAPVVNSANELTDIGLGAGAMGVDAFAHATHNTPLSKNIQPYIKGTIGSVGFVQRAGQDKQAGNTGQELRTIAGGSLNDATNVMSVLPAGKGFDIAKDAGTPLLRRVAAGSKFGAAAGGGIGAASGTSNALENAQNPGQAALDVAGGAATGAATGAALGATAPVVHAGVKAAVPQSVQDAASHVLNTDIKAAAHGANQKVGQAGYVRVGFPKDENATKQTPTQVAKQFNRPQGPTFTQADVKSLASASPEFKANPVMTYRPAVGNEEPMLMFTGSKDNFRINAANFFPASTDLSKIPEGEQFDFSQALKGSGGKVPAITEEQVGKQLPKALTAAGSTSGRPSLERTAQPKTVTPPPELQSPKLAQATPGTRLLDQQSPQPSKLPAQTQPVNEEPNPRLQGQPQVGEKVSSANDNTMSKISKEDVAKALGTTPEALTRKAENVTTSPKEIAHKALTLAATKPHVEGGYYQTIEMRPDMATGHLRQTLIEHVPVNGGYEEHIVPPNQRPKYVPGGEVHRPTYNVATPEQIKSMDQQNPVKVNIGEVKAGDYEHARHIPLKATSPTQVAGKIAEHSVEALSAADKKIFIDAVEHPEDHPTMSKQLVRAVQDWRNLADRVSATSHALGGTEPRINNYFYHNVKVTTPEEKAIVERVTGEPYDPSSFRGVNALARMTDKNGKMAFPDIRSLHDVGLHLVDEANPAKQVRAYVHNAAERLGRQAVKKAFTEADREQLQKPHTVDFGDSRPLSISKQGLKEIRGYVHSEPTKAGQKFDQVSGGMKHVLLSASQYHPTNVNLLTAAPSLTLQGHPLRAAKGLIDTVATTPSFRGHGGATYSANLARQDLESGLVEKAAEIGMPMGRSDYNAEGTASKGGQMTFGRQIPAMYRQVAQATISDLEKRGVSLTSKAARDAGQTGNNIMGFIAGRARNLSPMWQRVISRMLLAPQFEMSKLNILGTALDPRSGSLARRNAIATIVGKYGVELGLAVAGGAAAKQTANNLWDNLKQTAISPDVPTGLTDQKGNNIKFKMPDSGASEIANLGLSLNRGTDGRLHLSVNNPEQIASNIATDVRDKFSPVFGTAVKLATNTDYAGKNLHQPNAPAGKAAEQDAATLITDQLPIGFQGLAYTKAVDNALPGSMREVLQGNKPGSNPVVKSGLSTFGLTPETDQSTGKGLQTKQYFDTLNKVTQGMNQNEKTAFETAFPQSKDPVTGQYINNNGNTNLTALTQLKADAMYTYPAVLKAATDLNKQLAADGQTVDPFYTKLTPDQQKAYLAYEKMPAAGPDRTDWINKNQSWYSGFANARTGFFNSLPAGDPNKPQSPIKYPTPTPAVQTLMTLYDTHTKAGAPNAWTSTQKSNFLNAHPEIIDQWSSQANYDNQVRAATGYAPLKLSPQATPQMQSYINDYNAASKAQRTSMRNSNPEQYQAMIAYYDSGDLSTINKQGAVSQLQGEPNASQAELKAILSLSQDIYKDPNNTYAIVPAGWMNGLTSASGGGGYGSSSSSKTAGGYPVFKAPSTFSTADAKLTSIMKEAAKTIKPKALSGKVSKSYHVGKVSAKATEKVPKPIKARKVSSIRSDGLIKLGI